MFVGFVFGVVAGVVCTVCLAAVFINAEPSIEHKRELMREWSSEMDLEARSKAQAAAAARKRFNESR